MSALQTTLTTYLGKHVRGFERGEFSVVVTESDGGIELTYHTAYDGDLDRTTKDERAFPLLWRITESDVASRLRKLEIVAEEAGENGTQAWDLTTLLDGLAEHDTSFVALEALVLPLNGKVQHNRRVVGRGLAEDGMLGAILDRCPALTTLVTPSAPSASFFVRDAHPLRELVVHAGYDHQDFIEGLAKSRCFPHLETLTFRDYAEVYVDDYDERRVPGKQLLELLRTKTLPALKRVHLVDVGLEHEDAAELRALAKKRGIRVTGEAWLPE